MLLLRQIEYITHLCLFNDPPAAVNMTVCGETDRFMNRANLKTWLRFQWIRVTPLSLRADPVCLRPVVLAPHKWNRAALAPGPSWLLCPKSAMACRWDPVMEIKGLYSTHRHSHHTHTHTQSVYSLVLYFQCSTCLNLLFVQLIRHAAPDNVLCSYCTKKPLGNLSRGIWFLKKQWWMSEPRTL